MTGRRAAAAALVALILPACAPMSSDSSSPGSGETTSQVTLSADEAARKKPRKKKGPKARAVRVTELLPAITQQGARPARANAARSMVTVQVRPKRKNFKVVVQVKVGKKKWRKAGQGRTNAKGRVMIPARSVHGKVARYRARVGKKVSKPVNNRGFVRPTFSDEFNGKRLSNRWTHRVQDYNPEGFRACSRGNPRAVRVGGGTLRLSVMKDPTRNDRCVTRRQGRAAGRHAYRINGHISTEDSFDFTYGYAAARIKFGPKRGQHGSFWLQPNAAPNPPSRHPRHTGAEIDIIEYFGRGSNGITSFTYHLAEDGTRVKTGDWIKRPRRFLAGKKDDWFKRYHVFSVEWTPRSYVFRIDGKVSWRSNVGISGQPQFPILSLLSSDYEIPNLPGGDKKLPAHMHVDWIRVWETPR